MTAELFVAGVIVVLVAVLARAASIIRRRREPLRSVSEAQARENAAPLTTAILADTRRERAQ
jgi:hypothetical protein